MAFFSRFAERRPPVSTTIKIELHDSRRLLHAPDSPTTPRDRSVWEVGTGVLAEPGSGMGAGLSSARDDTVLRIRFSYENKPVIYAIQASKQDVDILANSQEWVLVCYCATNASDREVQRYAVGKLINAKRFYDVLAVIEDRGADAGYRERLAYALPILEQHVDEIAANAFVQDMALGVNKHLIKFMSEHITNLIIAERLIAAAKANGVLSHLSPMNLANRTVNLLVLNAWKESSLWLKLYTVAPYLFSMGYIPEWQHVISLFERHAEELIGIHAKNEVFYAGKSILMYVAEKTSNIQVAKRLIDVLYEQDDYQALCGIAVSASEQYEIKDPMGNMVLATIQRENADEIGKYAVDKLALAGQNDQLCIITAEAKLPSVQLYTQQKRLSS